MKKTWFEREFLKLAASFIRARYQLMTGHVYAGFGSACFGGRRHYDIRDAMMGATDNAYEMRLLCREILG